MAKFEASAAVLVIFLASSIAIQCASGELVCENLPADVCTFAISSSGMRCVLEKYRRGGEVKYECKTSQVKAENMAEWIETDKCIDACGVDRSLVGISSDSLLNVEFLSKLCAAPCYKDCPNIVDLYFNLAAAEGAFLPKLCEAIQSNPRRGMMDVFLSGFTDGDAAAPASAPAPASMSTP
ncbi:uncharacterized protein LOC116266442 [Nymphaea colorata]|nr:uncharacterized protein LOC116266442 [Nymphaea colorata]